MSVSISTDQETDRLLSLRASSQVPLPPEVCLADPRESAAYFAWALPLEAMGFAGHPMVALLRDSRRRSMMASALSRAEHLDRVSHLSAWQGREFVRIEDLAALFDAEPGAVGEAPRGVPRTGGGAAPIHGAGTR